MKKLFFLALAFSLISCKPEVETVVETVVEVQTVVEVETVKVPEYVTEYVYDTPLNPLAGKMFTKVTIAPDINGQIRLRANGDIELGYHEAYESSVTVRGFRLIDHTDTKYWPLTDFLLSPGVENHDVIRFNYEGKIDYIYKDFSGIADLEIVIGTTHGTTTGSGQLDPALFASNVQLSGWPLVYTQAGVSHNGYTVKISGGNLASGSQLTMLPWFDFSYTIPYIIYGTTHNIVNYTGNVYTYP
jgi:hypothetical protein